MILDKIDSLRYNIRVYGDEAEAQKKFKLYKKCTRVYKDAYKKHNSFERLVVSSHNK